MKILIVGLGSMGKRRIRNLRALGISDIAGFDTRADRRSEAAERYGISTFGDWDAARDWPAKAWIVSTPPLTHAAIALQAVESGRHVFTEADLPDPLYRRVIAARNRAGLIAAPSCTMTHHPGPVRIRTLLAEGAVGKPRLFAYHTGQHLADWHPWEHYAHFYAGQRRTGAAREIVPFELVWLTRQFGPVSRVAGLHGRAGRLEADIDDHYALALCFASGVSGTLLIDVLSRPEVRALRIVGDGGVLEWDHGARLVRVRQPSGNWHNFELDGGTPEAGYINPEEPYIAEMDDFLAAIRGDRIYPYSYDDDEAVLDVLLKAEAGDTMAVTS